MPAYELARDARVVDAGLNFQGSVQPTTAWASSWTRADSGAGDGAESEPPAAQTPAPAFGAPPASGPASVTFQIPLQVTVSLGAPEHAAAGVIAAGGTKVATPGATVDRAVEKVPVIYPDIASRAGYQKDFLQLVDGQTVPMPLLTADGKALAARLDDGSYVLNYHKFSVVMHKKRRLALFTAANVDWRPEQRKLDGRKPTRQQLNGFTGNEGEDWVTDSRLPLDHQLPDYFYARDGGAFDRGHLVRREDVAWGDSFADMQMGNGDTFHTTNCSPQVAAFNQSRYSEFNWGALENMIQRETKSERVCVFSGPVLEDDDPFFHGLVKSRAEVSIQIPRRFWKIIVANLDGQPAAFGFVLDQDLSRVDLHTELAVPEAWKTYMKPITAIEGFLLNLAKLGPLRTWDQMDEAQDA